ncbi:MAG TPA: hypothetical protein VMV49_14190 [Candidatus Deferrimicrobium sp.]|nr:hypothetical protein [Candidatus Deferrimicrobium sp.]
MPIMIFSFLRVTIQKLGRPATTKEVETTIKERLPMCVDHAAIHLRELEAEKVVEKKFDKQMKAYVWDIPEPYNKMAFHELIETFPQLYKESLYICAIYEMDKTLEFDEIVNVLFDLSEGSDTRPAVQAIKNKFTNKFLEKFAKKE